MRDVWIGTISEMHSVINKVETEYERELRRLSTATPPAAKRAATTPATEPASAARRFRVLKAWDATKQAAQNPNETFLSVALHEVLIVVGDADLEATWMEVERATDGERGKVAVKKTNGDPRLEEIQAPQRPTSTMVSSDEEDDECQRAEAEAEAMDEAAFTERCQEAEKAQETTDRQAAAPQAAAQQAQAQAAAEDAGESGPSIYHEYAYQPTSLPAGWKATVDPASGYTFYFHQERGVTQWERPAI
jgi:hypothetical protein